jgi:membrane protein
LDEAEVTGRRRLTAREFIPILRESFSEFLKDKAPRLAAGLSYYALFSLTPILLISIAIAGLVFGDEAARGEILKSVSSVSGETAGKGIEEMILNAREKETSGAVAAIVGFGMLLFGASGVFNQLKDALNTIWEIPAPKRGGIFRMLRQRFLSVAMVMVVGFLLLISLVINAALAAAGGYLEDRLPGNEVIWQTVNILVSIAVITVLFAMIFRYVPDKRIPWNEVWIGAAFTAVLFNLGEVLIGLYLGKSSVASAYGAAGSVVVILVWVYYSSLLLFFGAEFTEVFARRRRGGDAERGRGGEGAMGRGGVTREPHLESYARASTPSHPISTVSPRRSGGKVAPVMTGCAGLIIGVFVGIGSAIIGVVVTAITSLVKKLR